MLASEKLFRKIVQERVPQQSYLKEIRLFYHFDERNTRAETAVQIRSVIGDPCGL